MKSSHFPRSRPSCAGIAPGIHAVDFVVRVRGTLTVGEDETYTPTADVPLIPAMALALQRSGLQRDGIVALLVSAMRDVLEGDQSFRDTVEASAGLADAEALFRAGLATLPKKTRHGKVSAKVTATSLSK